jgi:3-hydroxybutyryl-CoA dehydratase
LHASRAGRKNRFLPPLRTWGNMARRAFLPAMACGEAHAALCCRFPRRVAGKGRNEKRSIAMPRDFAEVYLYNFEDLKEGQTASIARTVSEADIFSFAGVSGDTNPVHVDQEFAASTMFKGRIAHGMLSAAYISTVLGTKLPGPGAIYLSQTVKFKAPVRIGDTVVARATITALDPEKRRITLSTICTVGDTEVTVGEAQIMLPKH